MKTLKKLVAKHWALIGLLAGVYVDHSFEILANSGLSDGTIKLIHLSGVVIVGYFWNPKKTEQP
jgi:hypothetical protein